MQSDEACKPPPSYEEATLQDLPGLRHFLRRGEFMVYSRDINGKHEIKNVEKELLYKAKWESVNSQNKNLIIKNADKKEVLKMTRVLEDKGIVSVSPNKEMVLTAVPDIPVGRLRKNEKRLYEVIDQTGLVVYHVEKLVNRMHIDKHCKVMTPDGAEIGTIGDNKGEKLVLKVPPNLPVSHKALLLGLTLSKIDEHDDATGVA